MPNALRIGVIGLDRETVAEQLTALAANGVADLELREATTSDVGGTLRLRRGAADWTIQWQLAPALSTFEEPGAAGELAALDGVLVRLARADDARLLEELVKRLPTPDQAMRSRVALSIQVPALGNPVGWLDQARSELNEILAARLRAHTVGHAQQLLGEVLDWQIAAAGRRALESLNNWIEDHPLKRGAARDRAVALAALHPRDEEIGALVARLAEQGRRGRRRLIAVPIVLAALAIASAVGFVGWRIVDDRRQFEHASAFEGAQPPQKWLAIDAYRRYLAARDRFSPDARAARARARIAALSLELLETTAEAEPGQLEPLQGLADAFERDHPEHPGRSRLPAVRQQLARRLAEQAFEQAFARYQTPTAALDDLEQTWSAFQRQAGAAAVHATARYQALLARRGVTRDAELWESIRRQALRTRAPEQRIEILRSYLTRSRLRRFEAQVKAAIAEEHALLEETAWREVAGLLPSIEHSTREKLTALDRYLASHPGSRFEPQARQLRAQLATALDDADWKRTLDLGKAERDPAGRIRILLAHPGRLQGFRCVHGKALEQAVADLRLAIHHQRYVHLKRLWESDPTRGAEVALGFEGYLRDFPHGAHRGTAERFLTWWRGLAQTRNYRVTVRGAHLNRSKLSDGESEPDPYVVLTAGGQTHRTRVRTGYNPQWDESFVIPWRLGQSIRLTVWDKDLRYDDEMLSIVLSGPLALAKLRARVVHPDGHAIDVRCSLRLPRLP